MITVSLRQAVIPDHLLGRVNSVYRFFGWGMIPVGGLIGGVLVAVLDGPLSREWALRVPWIVAGVAQLVVALVVVRSFTTRPDRRRAGRRQAGDAAGRTRSARSGPPPDSLEQALRTGSPVSTGSSDPGDRTWVLRVFESVVRSDR